ncbi:sulfurase [Kocuria dechangensis]|uniref:Sulfurase n=1 Tax=Kocuria dechangensis TaxID=1176249 RepID=A0A917LNA0_9MICC|nr:MOSC domain-containing protein [Kocuria dechangensis]GGG46435.1 sulfurase [Kocuria dechangensis]
MTARVESVNTGRAEPNPARPALPTGIRKQPVEGPVELRDPGPRRGGLGSGVAGDFIGNSKYHGGTDQAVYAFAREELDFWEREIGREIPDGAFGENLTLSGFEVDDARLGDRWRVGDVLLQVTDARIPCGTFRAAMEVRGWLRRFTERGRTGAYLKVLEPGTVRAGDPVELVHRAPHGVRVVDAFRAQTTERERLPELLAAGEDLRDQLRQLAEKELARSAGR